MLFKAPKCVKMTVTLGHFDLQSFWGQPATSKNDKGVIIGGDILRVIGGKHSKAPLKTTTRCPTHLKLCKRPSDILPTHP